jgi:hypothetical protein
MFRVVVQSQIEAQEAVFDIRIVVLRRGEWTICGGLLLDASEWGEFQKICQDRIDIFLPISLPGLPDEFPSKAIPAA